MTITHFKKLCLFSLIGFLTLSALIAVISLLSGDFGSTEIKVIMTALTISGASICAMSCSAFIEKHGLPLLGGVGVVVPAVASIMTISGIWAEIGYGGGEYWKTTLSLIIVSAAFAHCLLLWIPSLAPGYRWTQVSLVIFVTVLSLQVIFAICGEIREIGYYRLVGVVAVIVVLLTLIVPICLKLSPASILESTRLKLQHDEGDIYRDRSGARYRVTKIQIEPNAAGNRL